MILAAFFLGYLAGMVTLAFLVSAGDSSRFTEGMRYANDLADAELEARMAEYEQARSN